jgi:hypothetical protein
MEEQLIEVKTLREQHSAIRSKLDALQKKFYEDNAYLIETEKDVKGMVAIAEDVLRTLAIQEYNKTKKKKFCNDRVGIRIVKKPTYCPDVALDWAKEHDACLLLDVKSFDKLVLSNAFSDIPARIDDIVTATIAKELEI